VSAPGKHTPVTKDTRTTIVNSGFKGNCGYQLWVCVFEQSQLVVGCYQWSTNFNNTRQSLGVVYSRILIRVSGVEECKTCLFRCPPHKLDSSNFNQPPILWWRRMKKGRFTISEEDQTIYPHACLCPVIYVGTVVEPHGTATLLRCTLSAVVK
jgi:hypothetical protein